MFMLLPPCLYLVVVLALRCFFPVVVVVVVDGTTATVGIRSPAYPSLLPSGTRLLPLNIPVN